MHSTNHRSQPFPLHGVAVAFLEISNTAALMKLLLLPIEIHMKVCELQAAHIIPTTTGLLLQNCFIQVIAATWFVGQRRCNERQEASTAVRQLILENSIQNNVQQ